MAYSLDDKNNILEGLVGGIKLYRLSTIDGKSEYEYLLLVGTEKTEHGVKGLNIDELIKAAWRLKTPKWTKLSTVCLDLINQTVWVDKTIEIKIVSIVMGKTGAVIKDEQGNTHLIDNLYIKE